MEYSEALWQSARSPNYNDNVDKLYPYSEVPYLGNYDLVKIPISLNDLIHHVDYWGEGRATGPEGTTGFSNCYNINYTFKLVSYGSDINRKIPNRIPIQSENEIDTSPYLKDNSVKIVTVMGENINESCAADIARIVNTDKGVVIVYGYEPSSPDIANLTEHLKSKNIYFCIKCDLSNQLQEVTRFHYPTMFVNESLLKTELYVKIQGEDYSKALFFTTSLEHNVRSYVLKGVSDTILNGDPIHHNKLMTYAYQLWTNGAKNIVRNHLPTPFKLIFGEEKVKIVNKGYNQAMKLGELTNEDGDRITWGDHNQNLKPDWQFSSIYIDNRVIFKIFNVDANMCLKLSVQKDENGNRYAYGSKECNTDSHKYIVEPFLKGGVLCFHIINYEYRQGLKLALEVNSDGDRRVYGHNFDNNEDEDSFKWIITD